MRTQFHYNLLRSLLVGLLLTTTVCARSQFAISEISGRFIKPADYDSIILEKAINIGSQRSLTAEEIKINYPKSRSRFSELLQALLQNPYTNLDNKYTNTSVGSSGFQKARQTYLSTAAEGVERALEYPDNFYPLFKKDNSDRILSFHSEIRIEKDGTVKVSEFISVYNGNGSGESVNDDIQRGIVRDFPTRYRKPNGLWTRTGFDLKAVLKNGAPEPYISEALYNGIRIMIGRKDMLLPEGKYDYRIDYETKRQLIFHPDKDEFYWNVNGNGWIFSADSISCSILFPDQSRIFEWNCYTGVQGATDKECIGMLENERSIHFWGKRRFESREGLTVAASIKKGVLLPPGKADNFIDLILSNYIIPVLLLLFSGLFLFYYRTWKRRGRDPLKGTIYPQFEPPPAFSPADTGYLLEQQFGSHLFAATLVDAAVHRELEIDVNKKGMIFPVTEYRFNKPELQGKKETQNMPADRYGFNIEDIYGETASKGTYNSKLKTLNTKLEESLKNRFLIRAGRKNSFKGMFVLNKGYLWLGAAILVLAIILAFIFNTAYFSLPLVYFSIVMIILMIIVQLVFSRIMSAYTEEGRNITDHIEGFRIYLKEAEQNIYNQLTPPEKTLDLFEKYLPYAIALKVENEWASKFDKMLQDAIASGYKPAYFHTGSSFGRSFTMSDLSKSISSGLTGTISSASTPPSSSSGGSGGGGSSGGGGGGGGGGGW